MKTVHIASEIATKANSYVRNLYPASPFTYTQGEPTVGRTTFSGSELIIKLVGAFAAGYEDGHEAANASAIDRYEVAIKS